MTTRSSLASEKAPSAAVAYSDAWRCGAIGGPRHLFAPVLARTVQKAQIRATNLSCCQLPDSRCSRRLRVRVALNREEARTHVLVILPSVVIEPATCPDRLVRVSGGQLAGCG